MKQNQSGGHASLGLMDKLWAFVSPVESDGTRKSTLALYSFCLSLALVAVNIGCYMLFVPPLEKLCGGLPFRALQLMEIIVPGLIGTAICSLLFLLPGDKRQLPTAYLWLAGYLAAFCLLVPVFENGTPETRNIIWSIAFSHLGVPVISGILVSGWLWVRYRRKYPHGKKSDLQMQGML